MTQVTTVSSTALLLLGVCVLAACSDWSDPPVSTVSPAPREAGEWPVYGGEGGRKFAADTQITAANVHRLKPAWVYHSGDVAATSAAENTPILVDGILYTCSPFNRISALDPTTGREIWSYDPQVDITADYSNQLVCRGVSHWQSQDSQGVCASRILMSTVDARLIAVDARTGGLCRDFGRDGVVDLAATVGDIRYAGEYTHTSAPAILGDRVIVGGAVGDHGGTDVPSGVVRAFNVRSGALEWAQDLAPPDYDYARYGTSSAGYALATPNVWAPMTVDAGLGLVYVPTGNPSPDYFRADEPDMDYYGSSLVALDGATGAIRWHYQFVHNDFWDFDTPAQPSLFEMERDGRRIPALAQGTKMGFIFVLDRRTGEPLFPVEERPVPQETDVDLVLSPTQPWPVLPEPVTQSDFDIDEPFGLTFLDKHLCRRLLREMHYDGLYTPPSTRWTMHYTGNAGGINWGGVAIDPQRGLLVVNASNFAWKVKLIPRAEFAQVARENFGHEIGPQRGTDYGIWREIVRSPLGLPCNPTPWGTLTGIDLTTGERLWQSTLGTTRDLAKEAIGIPLSLNTGTPNLGGPLVTGSGVTFIGAALDNYLRAFDNATGEEIWRHRLPAPAVATPMSYTATGADGRSRQYVVIAAGGYSRMPMDMSDAIIAFTLDD